MKQWTTNHVKTTVNGKDIPSSRIAPSSLFHPCVNLEHHKHETPNADTGENRSFPRQLQRGVEHILRWCESSSAEQATAYTRLAAMTQLFHRSWKKISHKEALGLTTRQTTVNRKQIPNKKSPSTYVRPICYSQISQAWNAKCKDMREQITSTSTPKRSGTYFTIVWIFECIATDSSHKTCGNDTSLPTRQKKNISQGSIGPYNTPKQLWTRRTIQQKIRLSNMFDQFVIPKHHKHKTQDGETGENRSLPRQLPKRSGTCFTMVWIIECRATDSLHKTSGNDTSLPSKQKKNLTRKHWVVQHAK